MSSSFRSRHHNPGCATPDQPSKLRHHHLHQDDHPRHRARAPARPPTAARPTHSVWTWILLRLPEIKQQNKVAV